MGIGYVRPVQFLDHLTVIKKKHPDLAFVYKCKSAKPGCKQVTLFQRKVTVAICLL